MSDNLCDYVLEKLRRYPDGMVIILWNEFGIRAIIAVTRTALISEK